MFMHPFMPPSPPLSAPHSYHGYWPTDMYRVNPHFGTADELQDVLRMLAHQGCVAWVGGWAAAGPA